MPRSGQKKKKKKVLASKSKKKNVQPMPTILFEIIGIVMLGIAALMAFQLGKVGRMLFNTAEYMAGYLAFLIPATLVLLAVYIMVKRDWPKPKIRTILGTSFVLTGAFLICHLIWRQDPFCRSILQMYLEKRLNIRKSAELYGRSTQQSEEGSSALYCTPRCMACLKLPARGLSL